MKLWAKNGRKRKLLIIIKSPEEGLVQGWNMLCKIKCELKNSYLQASCVCKNWFINQKEWCFFPQKFCRISAASLAQTASPFNEYCVWRAKEGGGCEWDTNLIKFFNDCRLLTASEAGS
jgi:hypothetical protein